MRIIALTILVALVACQSGKTNEPVVTESGLMVEVLQAGDGPESEPGRMHRVHIILTDLAGKEIWTTRENDEPMDFIFKVDQMIPGFDEAIGMMKQGDRFKVTVPSELGYGEQGRGATIPPNTILVFDIELLEVQASSTE